MIGVWRRLFAGGTLCGRLGSIRRRSLPSRFGPFRPYAPYGSDKRAEALITLRLTKNFYSENFGFRAFYVNIQIILHEHTKNSVTFKMWMALL